MRRKPRFWFAVGLMAVLAVGAFFRLMWLGDSAFRADTILFYDLCHRPLTAGMIFTDWIKLLGRTSQFPFALAFTKGFIDFFHLPITDFMIRLPTALFGMLTIPVTCMGGALVGGRRFGLFAGLLLAVNPFHIQLSREAYFYPSLLLGGVMMLWCVLWLFRRRNIKKRLPVYFYAMTAMGFFLLTYSHLSGWWLACFLAPFTLIIAIRRLRMNRGGVAEIVSLAAIYGVIGIPLLLLPWAVPYFVYDLMHPEIKAHTLRIFGENILSFWSMIFLTATGMAWGRTAFRVIFTVGVAVAAVVSLAGRFKANRCGVIVLVLFMAADMFYYFGQRWTGTGFAVRHQAFLMPLYLLVLAYGVWNISSLGRISRRMTRLRQPGSAGALRPGEGASPRRDLRLRRIVDVAFAAGALLFCLEPAMASVRLTGQPTPYKAVTRWCDTHLPPGTPVLVDRWFEPWNELKVHNSTNVFFTYTIPNEPLDVYLKYHWRETAQQFFQKYPDAAYLEIMKSYWDKPEVGPWEWPRRYFAQHMAFSNEAGMKLRALGLAYREDFYMMYTNRLIVELFYNTPEDVMASAKASGKTALVLFGKGWGYVKTQDYRDWRVLEKEACLDVYNLRDTPQSVALKITAVAVSGNKLVQSSEGFRAGFDNQKLVQWSLDIKALSPGLRQVKLTDSLWDLSRVPLLVERVEVVPGQK